MVADQPDPPGAHVQPQQNEGLHRGCARQGRHAAGQPLQKADSVLPDLGPEQKTVERPHAPQLAAAAAHGLQNPFAGRYELDDRPIQSALSGTGRVGRKSGRAHLLGTAGKTGVIQPGGAPGDDDRCAQAFQSQGDDLVGRPGVHG